MDDILGATIAVIVGISLSLSGVFVFAGSLDSTVTRACRDRGYWQTGQTRVLCSIEVPTTQEHK